MTGLSPLRKPGGPLELTSYPYKLTAPVGRGRMGVVWRGVHLDSGAPVAVKFFTDDFARTEVGRRILFRELRAALSLDHPHVVTVFEVGQVPADPVLAQADLVEGTPFVVMEWLPVRPLQGHKPRWPELQEILVRVLGALSHIHALGMTHGAVSASNVLRAEDVAGVRLCDLGMSRIEQAFRDSTDLTMGIAPLQLDLAAVGRLATEAAGTDAPEGLPVWLRRMRRPRPGQTFRHPADAAAALFSLSGRGVPAPSERSLFDAEAVVTLPMPTGWRRALPGSGERRPRSLSPIGSGQRPVPVVGRNAERDLLWAALTRVRTERRPQIVLLQGGAGVGKRTLSRWLTVRAFEGGNAVFMTALHSPVPAPAVGLVPMLTRFLRCAGLPPVVARSLADDRLLTLGVDEAERRSELLDLIAPIAASDEVHSLPLAPAERHARMIGALRVLGRERPVIILIEDVQWGMDALRFIERLLLRGGGTVPPVLVVMTVRQDLLEQRPNEAALIKQIAQMPQAGVVPLLPLAPSERRQLLFDSLHLELQTAARLGRATRGIPLFAVAMVRDLHEAGLLRARPGQGRALVEATAEVPTTVEQVWLSRLARVLDRRPAADAISVEIAAVLGGIIDPLEWEEASAAAGVHPGEGLVGALEEAGLAVPQRDGAPGMWSFSHGTLIRTLVRRAARSHRLASHHRACAAVVQKRLQREHGGGGAATALHARLVRHLVGAQDLDQALRPLIRAVRALVQVGESFQARQLLDAGASAIQHVEARPQDPRGGEIWVLRAEIAWQEGRYSDVSALSTRAEAKARRHGWKTVLAHALILRARVSRLKGDAELAARRLFDAESISEDLGDRWLRGVARLETGRLALEQGELDEAEELGLGALSDFERIQDRAGSGQAMLVLADLARLRGDVSTARSRADRARKHFEAAGRRLGVAQCHQLIGDLDRVAGLLDDASAAYRSALADFEAVGSASALSAHLGLARLSLRRGAWRKARAQLEDIVRSIGAAGDQGVLGVAHLGLVACAAGRGDWAAFDAHLTAGRTLLNDSGRLDPDIAGLAESVGDLAEAGGQARRARRAYRIAIKQHEAVDQNDEALRVREKLEVTRW